MKTIKLAATALVLLLGGTLAPVHAGSFPTLDAIKVGPSRFKLVLGGQAALDKETGLVWELAPGSTEPSWSDGVTTCLEKVVGARLGWRMPAAEELLSLLTPDGSGVPSLPSGHPFVGATGQYWTGSHWSEAPSTMFTVRVGTAVDPLGAQGVAVSGTHRVWCVRGGRGNDPLAY